MQALFALFGQYQEFTIALVLTIPRIYAFMDASQLLSSSVVSGMTRNAAMLSVAILLIPANLSYAHAFQLTLWPLVALMAKEYAIGMALGYFVAWIFWVVQTAGSFIDNQRGASIASSIDPLMGEESSPLGDMFSLVFITYLFASASVLQVLGLLLNSYRVWPIWQDFPRLTPELPRLVLTVFDYAMQLGFDLAAPVIAVMFLAEFALAMVGRFAPQVQVFVLAMPIKSMLAIFMLIFYSTVLFPYMNRQVDSASVFITRFYQTMNRRQPGPVEPNRSPAP